MIVSNTARYQSDEYRSFYKYRAYRTRSPSLTDEKITLTQRGNEWHPGGEHIWIRAGVLEVCLQFDQSIDQASSFEIYLDPQGAGAGERPVTIEPLSNPWSESNYPADTWTGTIVIPEDGSENWDGVATISISGAENFWLEPMEGSRQFEIFIDTQVPLTVTNPSVCFIEHLGLRQFH